MHFLSYWKRRHDAQITWPYAYYVTLGSRCKMAYSSSEDETDTLPERPTRIQPYQFEPVRQDFERVPEHRVNFKANPMQYSMGFAKSHSLKCSLHKWAWCGAARKSVNFFVDHMHTQFTEKSKMATALTPQTDVTSREAYRKQNRLKTQLNFFYFISLNLKLVTHLSIISMVILHT